MTFNIADNLYSSLWQRDRTYDLYTRITDYLTKSEDQAFWPIFNHQNNCIILSAQQANANAEHNNALLESELVTSATVAHKIWMLQKEGGKRKGQKFWICHISVVPGDVRIVRHFWTLKNHSNLIQNNTKFNIRCQISLFSQQNLPTFYTPLDWIEEELAEETATLRLALVDGEGRGREQI